jgi:hypothetical protein
MLKQYFKFKELAAEGTTDVAPLMMLVRIEQLDFKPPIQESVFQVE